MVSSEDASVIEPLPGPRSSAPLSLPRWTVPVVAVVVLAVVAVASVLLWQWVDGLVFVDADKKSTAHLDVLKLTASIAVGGGGLFALYLAARRQRTQELELAQRERAQAHAELVAETNRLHAEKVQAHVAQVAETNRAHAEQVAQDNRDDAAARRITDLFAKSVEQLGSANAAVRLGGMYALERLAQDNSPQRQTVVNVPCAYLRMPYEASNVPPPVTVGPAEYDKAIEEHQDRVQERQVRVAAQRILRDHMQPGNGPDPTATFWNDIDLDLVGATLVDSDLAECAVRSANFKLSTFVGYPSFSAAKFSNSAHFESSTFAGGARFASTIFAGDAHFDSVDFDAGADFSYAVFGNRAHFGSTTFRSFASFGSVTFAGDVHFEAASFVGRAIFESATFAGYAGLMLAAFGENAIFNSVTMAGDVNLMGAIFACGVPKDLAPFIEPVT
jgi:hypothetical protein